MRLLVLSLWIKHMPRKHPRTKAGESAESDQGDFISAAQDLEHRINALKASQTPIPVASRFAQVGTGYKMVGLVWRMVLELVIGCALGGVIGFAIDRWLGTLPWFLIIFTLLGFAAGVKTMLASVRELNAVHAQRAQTEPEPPPPST